MQSGITCSVLQKAYMPYSLLTQDVVCGRAFFARKNYSEAIVFYDRALIEDPTNYFALEGRGWAYLKDRKYKNALCDFNSALEHKSDSLKALQGRAEIHFIIENFSAALVDLNNILNLHPTNDFALVRRAEINRAKGDTLSAWTDIDAARNIKPLDGLGTFVYGLTLYRRRFFDHAGPCLKKSVEKYPKKSVANEKYGSILLKLGKFEEALSYLEAAIRRNPKNGGYRAIRADILYSSGKFKEIFANVEGDLKVATKYEKAKLYDIMGDAHAQLRNFEDARLCYQASVELKPDPGISNKSQLCQTHLNVAKSESDEKENAQSPSPSKA